MRDASPGVRRVARVLIGAYADLDNESRNVQEQIEQLQQRLAEIPDDKAHMMDALTGLFDGDRARANSALMEYQATYGPFAQTHEGSLPDVPEVPRVEVIEPEDDVLDKQFVETPPLDPPVPPSESSTPVAVTSTGTSNPPPPAAKTIRDNGGKKPWNEVLDWASSTGIFTPKRLGEWLGTGTTNHYIQALVEDMNLNRSPAKQGPGVYYWTQDYEGEVSLTAARGGDPYGQEQKTLTLDQFMHWVDDQGDRAIETADVRKSLDVGRSVAERVIAEAIAAKRIKRLKLGWIAKPTYKGEAGTNSRAKANGKPTGAVSVEQVRDWIIKSHTGDRFTLKDAADKFKADPKVIKPIMIDLVNRNIIKEKRGGEYEYIPPPAGPTHRPRGEVTPAGVGSEASTRKSGLNVPKHGRRTGKASVDKRRQARGMILKSGKK